MIILFLLFLIQFSIAASCLAVTPVQQQQFAGEGWNSASDDLKKRVQDNFLCCGFNATDTISADTHPSCENITVRNSDYSQQHFRTCSFNNLLLLFFSQNAAHVLRTESGSIWLRLLAMLTQIRGRHKLCI